MTLEDEFEAACWEAAAECRAFHYVPTAWIHMMHRWGAVEAAKRLLVDGTIQSGFERLIQEGRPELTVEWAVLQPRWSPLFSESHLAAARWRLQQAGHDA